MSGKKTGYRRREGLGFSDASVLPRLIDDIASLAPKIAFSASPIPSVPLQLCFVYPFVPRQ